MVEKRWRVACQKEKEKERSVREEEEEEEEGETSLGLCLQSSLPDDAELSSAFADRKKREGSPRGFGIRVRQSAQGSDSWVDDPITRHIITLCINRDGGGEFSLWPLVLHIKGGYHILVLPLVETQHCIAYERMCKRSDCGNSIGVDDSPSSLLLKLPCITG